MTKVHVIEADLTGGSWPVVLGEREKLGQQIVNLSRSTGEAVWFHEFKSDMLGGAPTIMLECTDAFMAKVRTLPAYRKDQEASPMPQLATQRSAKLQGYYMSGGATKRTGPDCKIIPPRAPKP